MTKKIIYEENPWDDIKDYNLDDFKVVRDLLPSPSELKKVKVLVDDSEILLVHLSETDMKSLRDMAENDGINYPDLAASVLHQFVVNNANSQQ